MLSGATGASAWDDAPAAAACAPGAAWLFFSGGDASV